MHFGAALLSLTAFGYTCHSAQAAPEALSEATFDHRTSAGVWFIKFVAPWCSHCKKLAPTIDELSEAEGLDDANVHVAHVDCTTERSLCERFSVGSYPTLKVVDDGSAYEYNGRRDVPSMVAFATDGYKREFGDAVLSYAEFLEQRKAAAAEKLENEGKSAVVQFTTLSFEEEVLTSKDPWLIKFYAPCWKATEPTGPIPEEGFFLEDFALLDYWLGADDVSQYKKTLNIMEGEKEEDGKEDELPPPTPSAIEAKTSGQKPKYE
ncbi:hypothetical protein PsorP6_010403 [Peronosclerospora sorghi]|uniref:Uncharacterized protein n=1 Tax=Peronosclerospora sorghi TaxID=230839 RepID=A0ACC0VW80_9STRA|nr:hypothetical protein PsorP6_010403 [Peronosclerospora sorghi]